MHNYGQKFRNIFQRIRGTESNTVLVKNIIVYNIYNIHIIIKPSLLYSVISHFKMKSMKIVICTFVPSSADTLDGTCCKTF